MLRFGLAATAIGAAALQLDPFGLGWLGAVLFGVGALGMVYGAAGAARRRMLRRTVEGLQRLAPGEFEGAVAGWLRRAGWKVEQIGGPGDGGIDLVARRGSETAVVQCKRLAPGGTVGAPTVRDLYGAASARGASIAVLVTTGRVSQAARTWVEGLPAGPRVELFDADRVAAAARRGRMLD
ncbi:MAG: hypothetical protein KatS3mg062_1327 [Tepidiforma sp.]|nr:MAG: hypothetical protein KatS3mg062_1327 [Tepidiforma sp.]